MPDIARHASRRMPLLALLLTAPASALAGEPLSCAFTDGFEPVVAGGFNQPDGPGTALQYVSSGGWTISILVHTITVRDPIGMNYIEHWGDPHENLNGKHLKDWEGERRSVVLDDGTRITMEAAGPQNVVLLTSIYDGHANLQVDNASTTVLHDSALLADTRCRERAQYDGETSRFSLDLATGVATYYTVHHEDANFQRTPDATPLGETGGFANPSQTNDYYDDPRLGHT